MFNDVNNPLHFRLQFHIVASYVTKLSIKSLFLRKLNAEAIIHLT